MDLVIASGYFSILHIGHTRYLQAARKLGDKLIVIVNNDSQQILKKGYIIVSEEERMEVVKALGCVDDVLISIDTDRSVVKSLETILETFPYNRAIFANGGDRTGDEIPEAEVCNRLGVQMIFGVGGSDKSNSTTSIAEKVARVKQMTYSVQIESCVNDLPEVWWGTINREGSWSFRLRSQLGELLIPAPEAPVLHPDDIIELMRGRQVLATVKIL